MKALIIKFFTFVITRNFIFFLNFLRFRIRFHESVKKPNQISIINTFDLGGGAAKIARDLANNFRSSNSLRLYVKTKKSKHDWVFEIQSKPYTFLEEILRREAVRKGWVEFTGFHAKCLLEDPFFQESSVVHLHNLHGEFFSPSLFKSLFKGKKVIWTLHDESLITGHCSCTLGCDRWQIGCGSCPDLTIYPSIQFDNTKDVLHYKKKWITELQPIVVCPSHWLANRVRIAYPALKNITVIPNGVDTDIFQPKEKAKVRALLGFPDKKKIVLFVAEFATQNPFKGGAILREIISDSTFSDVIFVTVGGSHESTYHNHICYPYIEDENELANLYAACDVLLYPTQADNLPLVVLESMACGTPVIASKIGGIPEIISHQQDGFLVDESTDFKVFRRWLLDFLLLNLHELYYVNQLARIKVEKFFSKKVSHELYKKIYNESIKK